MQFGGLTRFSLVDFPGRDAAVLFTRGCNLACPYCHNAGLIDGRADAADVAPATVTDFLERRAGKLDGVVFSGGEPTLHHDLADWCRRCKELGYSVKLDSNGLRPDIIESLLAAGLLDHLALDVKAAPARYLELFGAAAAGLRQSIAILAGSGVAHEFRTTVAWPLLSVDDVAAIARELPPGATWRLQDVVVAHVDDPFLAADARPFTAAEKALLTARLADSDLVWSWRGDG